ncbi:MAG: zinc dependent phospholipase C family protein [Bacteroidetes bacterium]|nr:zinc dependent phospholipase C family protein [Bacteroidota bacterium]HET6243883.1 zinc dependent phospholipase C family protein [Bacteroidia bacterium]
MKNEVAANLPEDNFFKGAMLKYPHIAAWGAVGPDLGYNPDFSQTGWGWKRHIKNSFQLAEISHYNQVGSFALKLIQEAKSSKDERFAAFVGGWITHIAGDFGAHSIFVEPEAGFYISNESGRHLHGELEKYSDAYLFKKYAKKYCLSGWDVNINYFWEEFFGIPAIYQNKTEAKLSKDKLTGLIGDVEINFKRIYYQHYETDTTFSLIQLAKTYHRALGVKVPKFIGFDPFSMEVTMEKIKLNERGNRIDSAFNASLELAYEYLTTNDPNVFSNKWNLDIGIDGGATYVVRIKTDKGHFARSKNDLYIQFTDKNGKKSPVSLLTSKISKMKFTVYQSDNYYYHINMGGSHGELNCWDLDNLQSALIISRPKYFYSNILRIHKISLFHNGIEIAKKERSVDEYLRLTGTLNLPINKPH